LRDGEVLRRGAALNSGGGWLGVSIVVVVIIVVDVDVDVYVV